MFSKKCPRCRNKIKKNYDFCPFCGSNFSSANDKKDYGMLGKNDFIEESVFRTPFGDSVIDKMFNSSMKMAEKIIEKQMKTISERNISERNIQSRPIKTPGVPSNLRIQFFVNGKRVFPQTPQIEPIISEKAIKIKSRISEKKLEKFAKLPKQEPNSKVRRLSGKIIYELEVPGVEDIEDVLINQLENSIEIKALTKDKTYSKILNVNLPVLGYRLDKGNLILELQAR